MFWKRKAPPLSEYLPDAEIAECDRLWPMFKQASGYTPQKAQQAFAAMALAGDLQMGVALRGNISVWGRPYSPPVLTQQLEPIPKDHWRTHEISAVAFLDDHLGESWTRYSALAPEPALKDLNFEKREIRAIRRQWKKNHDR